MDTTTGTVAEVRRLGRSKNGHPRWRVTLTDGRQYATVPDGQVGYMADNYRTGAVVTLTLNKRKQIVRID